MKTLLLLDDDVALRKQLRFALESHYEVHEAGCAEEALDVIQNHTLDIALTDLGLPPYENSYEEGRQIILALMQKSDAKVIVLTGQENSEYAKELIGAGVFDYLLKPIEIPMLLAALKRAAFFIEHERTNETNSVKLSFHADLESGLKGSSDEAQKQLLLAVLKRTDFNVYKSAKILGISRENCYYFLKKFNIERQGA